MILSQASTTGHPAKSNSELLFMPAQSNNSSYNGLLYFETDYSRKRSHGKSTVFSRDGNLEKRNDVQLRTKMQEESSSMGVSTNSKGCRLNISPDVCSRSESFYGQEVERNTIPGFLPFDHLHSLSTQTGKQSHAEEFSEDVRLPFNGTVSYPCRAGSASNVVNEFDCKVRYCCVNAFKFYQIHSHWTQKSLLLRLNLMTTKSYLLKKDKRI